MKDLALRIVRWRESKGFCTPNNLDLLANRDAMLGKLMLVVTEIAEAAEAVRHRDLNNFKEEIADAFIRLLDIAGTMEFDPEEEIERKMVINEQRPFLHGKETNL